jgi:hypothetical protein
VTVLAVLGGLLLQGAATHASCRCRPVADYAPIWSPNDTEIAYTEAYTNAHVVSRATGDDSITASPTPNLVYSPDWREAAAIVNDNARGYLLVLVRPGATVPTIDSAFPTPPAWSPDGLRLAYIGADEGLHIFDEIANDTRLVAARVYPYSSPAWSPDGSSLAFVSGKDVFVAPTTGGAVRDVTHAVPGTHVDPVWSPHGDALAVNTDFGRRIVVVGVDGAPRLDAESQLPVAYTGLALSWSPRGDKLLYSHRFNPAPDSPGVYELDTTTGQQQELTAFGIDAMYSHDGSAIAFGGTVTIEPNPPSTVDCVGVGIWTIPAAGGKPSLVTRTCNATPPTLSIHAPRSVEFGDPAELNGGALPGFGDVVDVAARGCGRPAPSTVAVADGGAWSATMHPTVTTEYTASAGRTQVTTRLGVKPVVVLRRLQGLAFEVRLNGGRSFAGRTVHVELLQHNGKSKLLRRVRLRSATRARFRLSARDLHPWLESLYIAVPRAATGPCLEPAVSNTLPVSRP